MLIPDLKAATAVSTTYTVATGEGTATVAQVATDSDPASSALATGYGLGISGRPGGEPSFQAQGFLRQNRCITHFKTLVGQMMQFLVGSS